MRCSTFGVWDFMRVPSPAARTTTAPGGWPLTHVLLELSQPTGGGYPADIARIPSVRSGQTDSNRSAAVTPVTSGSDQRYRREQRAGTGASSFGCAMPPATPLPAHTGRLRRHDSNVD